MRRLFANTAAIVVVFGAFHAVTGQTAASTPASRAPAPSAPSPLDARDSLTIGGRTVAAGTTEQGPVVVAGGDLNVFGTVRGTAIAIAGDVVLHPGGKITGDAISAFGSTRNLGGTIEGAARSLTGTFGASVRALLPDRTPETTPARSPLMLALGWFGVMLLIGFAVLIFASAYLEGVVDVLEQSFWRSFGIGILGQLGVGPGLLLVMVALAATVIGVLLVPFAVVAVVLGVAGLATLGFVAVARLTGNGLGARRAMELSSRGNSLRGVLLGLTLYMGLWVLAMALRDVPVAGAALRAVALFASYVAATAGFGAALLSRGGTRRDAAIPLAPAPAMNAAVWQTPTPVTGVVAARRPISKERAAR